MLQSKAGYIDARPLSPSRRNPLATHGRTIHWVKSGKAPPEHLMSAHRIKADLDLHINEYAPSGSQWSWFTTCSLFSRNAATRTNEHQSGSIVRASPTSV